MADDSLIQAVAAALAAVPRGATAAVAVSGGPDSVALLHLTARARPDLGLVVAHVRHGLRDDAVDAACAAAHAQQLGVAFFEREVVVRPTRREGLEGAARTARYAALAAIAGEAHAGWVLLGHTADDQAETVLRNAVRGAGIRGLAGMAPSRPLQMHGSVDHVGAATRSTDPCLVRPLLSMRRADVRAWAAAAGLASVDDPTNVDPTRARTVLRHEVLPALAELGGDPVEALARLAGLARDDADLLDALAAERAAAVVHAWGRARMVRRDDLDALPAALASRVVQRMLADVRGDAVGLSAATVEAVRTLTAGVVDLGRGVRGSAGGGWVAVAPAGARPAPLVVAAAPPDPSAVRVPPWGGPGCAAVPAGATVRAPRAGDRLPAGRTVADALARAGVPRVVRPLVPVVCVADVPVWAPGLPPPGGRVYAWATVG